MANTMRFDEILGAIEQLPPRDQEALLDILERRRIAEHRAMLRRDIAESRNEHKAGALPRQTAEEIMRDLLS